MVLGNIGFSAAGLASRPSPSIWGDCPRTILNDKGLGYYAHEDFLGGATGTLAAALDVATMQYNGVGVIPDTDVNDGVASHKAGEIGGYLDLQTGATDNDAIGIMSEPFGKIVRNSGNKLWFEARVELGALADQGAFFGLVEEANQTVDVVAANAAALISTDSFIGAQVLNDDTDGLDIVYQKDGGTPVVVLATASQSTAIAAADRFNIAADTEFKFGIRFDGRDQLHFYVNGVKVATQTVDSTIDQSNNVCALLVLKTGTAAANSFAIDWVRYGYQNDN